MELVTLYLHKEQCQKLSQLELAVAAHGLAVLFPAFLCLPAKLSLLVPPGQDWSSVPPIQLHDEMLQLKHSGEHTVSFSVVLV